MLVGALRTDGVTLLLNDRCVSGVSCFLIAAYACLFCSNPAWIICGRKGSPDGFFVVSKGDDTAPDFVKDTVKKNEMISTSFFVNTAEEKGTELVTWEHIDALQHLPTARITPEELPTDDDAMAKAADDAAAAADDTEAEAEADVAAEAEAEADVADGLSKCLPVHRS